MLEEIKLNALPCFSDSETITGLESINYFYGPNGTGKTSISDFLDKMSETGY